MSKSCVVLVEHIAFLTKLSKQNKYITGYDNIK